MLHSFVLTLALTVCAAFQLPVSSRVGSSTLVAGSKVPPIVRVNPLPQPAVVMSAVEVEDKVKTIIAEQLGVDIASVTPDASFTEDLGADSLDAVELIMAIEEAFDIEIPDEEAESMTTPADCVKAIQTKLA